MPKKPLIAEPSGVSNRMISVKEAAQRLGCSTVAIYDRMDAGTIRSQWNNHTHRWMVAEADLTPKRPGRRQECDECFGEVAAKLRRLVIKKQYPWTPRNRPTSTFRLIP